MLLLPFFAMWPTGVKKFLDLMLADWPNYEIFRFAICGIKIKIADLHLVT
jgi:hypothetical protein